MDKNIFGACAIMAGAYMVTCYLVLAVFDNDGAMERCLQLHSYDVCHYTLNR